MFYYFGRKARLAAKYPPPAFGVVIEPFAGSAAYTLYHRPDDALLIEADERVVRLWHDLAALSPDEVLAMEPPEAGTWTDDLFTMLAMASEISLTSTSLRVSAFAVSQFGKSQRGVARVVDAARGYRYEHGCYLDAPDVEATWFIDPPYRDQSARGYRHKIDDYDELADWCRSRRGQVIVCEKAGADWLPFEPLCSSKVMGSTYAAEVVWVKDAAALAPRSEDSGT